MGYLRDGTADFFFRVAHGDIPGLSAVQKFGRNPDIDTTAVEDVWAGGGSRHWLSSANILTVASASTADSGVDSKAGARTFTIIGLDANYSTMRETVTLNGSTAVNTTSAFLRLHRAFVATAGADEKNHGDITVDPVGGSTGRQALISSGIAQTQISHYTVPANRYAYLTSLRVNVSRASGGAAGAREAIVRMWRRDDGASVWRVQQQADVRSDGSGWVNEAAWDVPTKYDPKTDIKFTGEVDVNNTAVAVAYTLLLTTTK